LVDELVSDIQSGKKDLRECIEDYERQLDEEDGTFAIQLIREQEISYEAEIESLEDDISSLEERLDSKNYLIEELRVTISNQEKEIYRLELIIKDFGDSR